MPIHGCTAKHVGLVHTELFLSHEKRMLQHGRTPKHQAKGRKPDPEFHLRIRSIRTVRSRQTRRNRKQLVVARGRWGWGWRGEETGE